MPRAAGSRLIGVVERLADRSTNGDDYFAELSAAVSATVPFDGSIWLGVDPATLLTSAPVRIHNMDAAYCWPFWDAEFHEQDAAQFRDLARQPVPATSMRVATDGRPRRSARFREFMEPQGYTDEARVAFRFGATTWGVAALYRDKGRPSFAAEELDLLGSLSRVVADGLRSRTARLSADAMAPDGPGVLLFDGDTTLVSANAEAEAWLSRIYGGDETTWRELIAPDGATHRLVRYASLQPLVARARAVAAGHDAGPVRSRVRDRSGRWVVLHASCLDPEGKGPVAVIVEPAVRAEVAPIIVEAYSLSPRERDVVRALARGLSTPEIATELFLSTHTVRDYVKSVFEKFSVRSRGELIARLFADHHYESFLDAAVVTESVGPSE